MKIVKTISFVLFFLFMSGMTVFAGDINEHEQRVIEMVSKPVTYNGKEYIAKEQYIARLAAYLNQDNVDLTKEQADKAVNKFFESIEVGILEGYMEEVKADSGKKEEKPKQDGNDTNGNTNDGNEKDNDVSGGNSGAENVTEQTANNKNENNDSSKEESDEINEVENSNTEAVVGEKSGNISGKENNQTARPTESEELGTEEIARLQKERDLVAMLLEENSMAEEEANVYAELEAVESSIAAMKDYSDAEPFQKGISLGTVAIIVVVVVAILMAGIILIHKSKQYKRK